MTTSETDECWGVSPFAPEQSAPISAHCFGDCGKVSVGSALAAREFGGLFLCRETNCPYELSVTRDIGEADLFGKTYAVHLRVLRPES